MRYKGWRLTRPNGTDAARGKGYLARRGIGAAVRPHVTVNCAASIDGKIASVRRKQLRISSDEDMERVGRLRASSDAVLVGVGTVVADNPGLHAPSESGVQLLRVVVDSKGRTPPFAKVLDGSAPTLIAHPVTRCRIDSVIVYCQRYSGMNGDSGRVCFGVLMLNGSC